jgi:hypothetical protein
MASSVVCAGGVLYLYGGIAREDSGENVHVADLWSFDLQRSTWHMIAENSSETGGPGKLAAHSATVVDESEEEMLVFGGSMGEGEALSDQTWTYHFSTQSWSLSSATSHPGKRDFHTAVAIPKSAMLKVWGGVDDAFIWTFDAKSRAWSQTASGLKYESGRSGAFYQGVLFSFGGFAIEGTGVAYNNEVQWRAVEGPGDWNRASVIGSNMPVGRCFATFSGIGEGLYMFGGFRRKDDPSDPGERLSDIWQLSLMPRGTGGIIA